MPERERNKQPRSTVLSDADLKLHTEIDRKTIQGPCGGRGQKLVNVGLERTEPRYPAGQPKRTPRAGAVRSGGNSGMASSAAVPGSGPRRSDQPFRRASGAR